VTDPLTRVLAGSVLAVLVLVLLAAAAVTALLGATLTPSSTWTCGTAPLTAASGVLPLTGEQIANATTILTVAQHLGLPQRAGVIALATALQESGLRNLPRGDRDSVGLLQQRPSQGWGTTPAGPTDHRTPPQRLLDPGYAATAFYRALTAIPDWDTLPITVAAQQVQRSATPDAYANWGSLAAAITSTLTAQHCLDTGSGVPTSAAETAVAYARAQLGLPYEWGGNGPGAGDAGFDCSGLTQAAYTTAGITLPRTAQAQYNAGPRLRRGATPQPGDLVFYGTSRTDISHVGMIARPGYMIDAPHLGAAVRLEPLWPGAIGYTRPAGGAM
jgi:cell wall-associated NlpC family hydrolase